MVNLAFSISISSYTYALCYLDEFVQTMHGANDTWHNGPTMRERREGKFYVFISFSFASRSTNMMHEEGMAINMMKDDEASLRYEGDRG